MKTKGSPSEYLRGVALGFPITIGYFSAAIAFGILARGVGVSLLHTVLFSLTNFAGASQFMAVRMLSAGTGIIEIFIAIVMVNFRYFLMGASLSRKLEPLNPIRRIIVAFGDTDECFGVASLQPGTVSFKVFLGIESVAYAGWVGGTIVGAVAGSFLPPAAQIAMTGTLYAFFAALLGPELKKGTVIIVAALSAVIINVGLNLGLHLATGWSMVLSIALGAAVALGYETLVKGKKHE
jgi:4-azaleucine resistance transporter AzlC